MTSLHQFTKPVRESDSRASRNHKAQSLEHQVMRSKSEAFALDALEELFLAITEEDHDVEAAISRAERILYGDDGVQGDALLPHKHGGES